MYNCLCGVHSVLMCLCAWYIGKNARLLSVVFQPFAGYYSVRFARSCFLTWESLCIPTGTFSRKLLPWLARCFCYREQHILYQIPTLLELFSGIISSGFCAKPFFRPAVSSKSVVHTVQMFRRRLCRPILELVGTRPCGPTALHGMPFKYVVFQSSARGELLAHFSALL